MNFYDKMKQHSENVSITENGMEGYKTTFHPLVDMNFKISSYRGASTDSIVKDLDEVINSGDSEYILKFLFMVRDIRNGLGERDLFRVCLKHILVNYTFENKDEIVKNIISNQITKFGRFDDLFIFMDTQYQGYMIETVLNQLKQDYADMEAKKPISLLAKWMPSENTSSKKTRAMAKKFIKAFGSTTKEYRQTLSALRAYLKVTEVYASANEWDKIDYNQVPSKANLKYSDAFIRHDEERRRDYLAALRTGVDKEGNKVKINSSVNYPHEIVSKYTSDSGWSVAVKPYDEALEQLWKNLKQKNGLNNTIVVRDGSGSMETRIGNSSSVTALDVSTALAIYCSEHLDAEFKNKFLTFSARTKLIDLSEFENLHNKLKRIYKEDDCSNTNIESVFSLILNTAIKGKVKAEEMPKQILIVSDMEFDMAFDGFGKSTNAFEKAAKEYKLAGYQLPKLIFWNVNSRTNTIPLTQNENGVILVSGFSVNVLDMVMSGKTDPYEVLTDKLNDEMYNEIPLLTSINKVTEIKNKSEKTKPSWL